MTDEPSPSDSPSGSPSDSPSTTPTGDPSGSPSGSGSGSPTGSPSGSPSGSGSESPSGSPSATPSCGPTDDPTGTESPDPDPTCGGELPAPDGDVPAQDPQGGPHALTPLAEAQFDKIRDHAGGKRACDRTVLTAIGDSVTSSHIQVGFGDKCANTRADNVRKRPLPGNDATSGYAGIYADGNPDIVQYYNFARTGYSSQLMKAATYVQDDACANLWARNYPPVTLAEAVVRQAKADHDKAYVVGTAGANDTNWARIIEQALTCRAVEWAFATVRIPGEEFHWLPGSPANMIPDGGGCRVDGGAFGQPLHFRFGVERYDAATALPQITGNVRDITATMLGAGADKVVWMSYYDITPAQIDIGKFLSQAIRSRLSPGLRDKVGELPSRKVFLIDQMFQGTVRQMVVNVNAAIRAGLPDDAKVALAPPAVAPDELQDTMIGGAPHPNGSGHGRMARQLKATLDAL